MTIRIKHKFSDRLYINDESSKIDTIIIGTFNPGLPNSNILTEQERKQFLQVSNSVRDAFISIPLPLLAELRQILFLDK